MSTEPTPPPAAARLLAEAAAHVAEHGLHKGTYWPGSHTLEGTLSTPGQPRCLIGALAVAAGVWDAEEIGWACAMLPALRDALAAVRDVLGARTDAALAQWADDPERGSGDVAAVLLLAAAVTAAPGRTVVSSPRAGRAA